MYLYNLYKVKDVSSSVHGTVKYTQFDFSQSGDFAVSSNQTLNLYPRNQEIAASNNEVILKEGVVYDISLMCRTTGGSMDESVKLSLVDEHERLIVTTIASNIDDTLNKQEFPHGNVTIIPDKDLKVSVKVTEYGTPARKLTKDSHLFIKEIEMFDEFSTDETLTRKRWLGKPVYRKVISRDITGSDIVIPTGISASYCYIESWNFVSNQSFNISGNWTNEKEPSLYDIINNGDGHVQMAVRSDASAILAQFPDDANMFSGKLYVVLEYCK